MIRVTPMTLGDYASLMLTETSFGKPRVDASTKEFQSLMKGSESTELWSVRDAPVEAGRFPVVIYAPSFSTPAFENADLCEYLASNGYVVIASPDMGAMSRSMTMDVSGINTQARDISFLIGFARTLLDTDLSEVAVAGFSWGGISNLFAAARDNRIEALVSLDGSLRYSPALIQRAGDVHPEQMTMPFLMFMQGETTIEQQDKMPPEMKRMRSAPSALNAWTHGDLVSIEMLGMIHAMFSSIFQISDTLKHGLPTFQKADYGLQEGFLGYNWVARYTLEFLNAYLKHDTAAVAFLKNTPTANGVPKHFMTVDVRTAKGIPPSLDGFRTELGRRGFNNTAAIYAEMRKASPSFTLDENAVNLWADELIADNHLAEAAELLKLNLTIYPNSSDAYEVLGDADRRSGEKQKAIDDYKRSIEKNPYNMDAIRKLEELGVEQPAPKL